MAHVRLCWRKAGSWEVVPGLVKGQGRVGRQRTLTVKRGRAGGPGTNVCLGRAACLRGAGPVVRSPASWPKDTTRDEVGACAVPHRGIQGGTLSVIQSHHVSVRPGFKDRPCLFGEESLWGSRSPLGPLTSLHPSFKIWKCLRKMKSLA